MLFFQILLGFIIVLVALAGVAVPLGISLTSEDFEVRTKVVFHVAGLLVTVGAITLGVSLVGDSDNARHCGTGTTYQESSHYDSATKTTQTDWWCARG